MLASTTALAAGDYATAINNALAAQGLAGSLPKVSRNAGMGGGAQTAEWDAIGINNYVVNLRKQYWASLGVQTAEIEITEPAVLNDIGDMTGQFTGGFNQ